MAAAGRAFAADFLAHAGALALTGEFEAHLTVPAGSDLDAFAAACRELGVGCIAIELATGAHAAQPMTASRHRGALAGVLGEVDALHAALVARGFAIARVKLEAAAAIVDAPPAGGGYFEFHVEVATEASDPMVLARVAAGHRAHVSRNARRAGHRFVTLRVYAMPRTAAEARLDALVAALTDAGHAVTGCTREYALYDSRAELDAGWLDPP
jgi:hypothetical protein